MIHQTLFAGYSNPLRVVDGADFDGTNDYMTRGATPTGLANSKTGIISAWIRLDGGDGSALALLDSSASATNSPFQLWRLNTNKFQIQARDFYASRVLELTTVNTYTAGGTWIHILSSWNLATASAYFLYINDVSDMSMTFFVNSDIQYIRADFGVGYRPSGVDALLNGCLADVYFAPGQYLDFSLVANRRKFISASGKPVHLGTDGSLPTGTAPLLYLHLDDGEAVANFATNRGTGGNFSITGTLDTASSSPSD